MDPAAQPRDVGGVVLAQLEARAHGHGALGEQARRSGGADFVDAVAVRQSEWLERQRIYPATPSDSRLVASTRAPSEAAIWAATAAALASTCSQLSSTTSSFRPSTSAVRSVSASSRATVRPPSTVATASATDEPGSLRGEVAPADAVRELARELLRRVRGQRRLAHTAGAGERHHRRVAQQLCQASGLALASDEADPGQGHREGA